MLLVLGDRRFDVRHQAVVVGQVQTVDDDSARHLVEAGVVALVVPSSSDVDAVCERVDVPVGVRLDGDQVRFGSDEPVTVVASDAVGPQRMARVARAIGAGGRVVLAGDVRSVRSDRRVADVMARTLAARSST